MSLVSVLFVVLGFMAFTMLASWAFVLARRNGGWTDVFWTYGTGVALAGAALAPLAGEGLPLRQWLVAGLVAVWAIRLGTFVALRVAGHPEDRRYADFRDQWGDRYARNMGWVALPQGLATTALAVSVCVAARRPEAALDIRDALAVVILVVAILGETLADQQMQRFRTNPANKGKVADTGLWAWSRHPNYFFEWVFWLAWPAMAFAPSQPMTWLTLVAPVVMFLVLTRGTGIPPLEKAMLASRPDAYRDYQSRVSAFFPLPPKKP